MKNILCLFGIHKWVKEVTSGGTDVKSCLRCKKRHMTIYVTFEND